MKTKPTLICLALALCVNINSINAQVNVQDSLALVDFYNSTNGPNWVEQTNWLTKNPVSTWYGIEVTNTRVTSINLNSNKLSGSIPSSIGKLVNLRELHLTYNQLSGSIPSAIGNLVNLQDLALPGNQLTGKIPSSIGNLVNLIGLGLYLNQLSGSIPSSIGTLVNLSALDLFNNKLNGSIPSSIGNLVNLEDLELNNNQLSGGIPSSIGNLINLSYLELGNNQLSGAIPSSIGKLVNLRALHLIYNQFSGSIPSSLINLIHIDDYFGSLDLSHNHFTFDGMELIAQKLPRAIYYPQRLISVHQNGNALSVYAGGTLSNNTYKWFKCEGTSAILVATIKGDSIFHPSESGKYRVKVLNSVATQLQLYTKLHDYTSMSNAFIASAQNPLQQDGKTNLFLVYPNPARDILHVETNGNATFSLINQSAKILLTTNINGKGVINVSGLPAGLYYLKNIQTREVSKVIIAR